MTSSLKEIINRRIDMASNGDGFFPTAVDGLTLCRSRTTSLPSHRLYKPALCLVVQGAKQVLMGGEALPYEETQALIVSLGMPINGNVTRASADKPYLGIILEFDARLMRDVLDHLDQPPKQSQEPSAAVFVQKVDGPLADSMLRLLQLLDMPAAVPVLQSSILREVYFWLLTGPNGEEIAKLATTDSHTERLGRAIHLLHDLSRPVGVEEMAAAAKMSISSFHQHFKALTSMTPLQFQKQLRLLEARRLMLIDAVTATTASYQVGYESPSQFSREYARMFGAPPRRDVEELRTLAAV